MGSVGQPRNYDNRASYTIYDTSEKTFELKRVAYDIDGAAQKTFAADLPSPCACLIAHGTIESLAALGPLG